MKEIAVCFALFSVCAAFAVEVGELPQSAFADTEVSTNVAFAVGAHANRKLVFTLELQATASNNVEVAIGCVRRGHRRTSFDCRIRLGSSSVLSLVALALD